MILEVAEIYVNEGEGEAFESAIAESFDKYIAPTEGFISAEVQKGIEDPTRYLLLVRWETLDAHMVNFRESDVFPKHRALISPYFAKPPFVQHFEVVGE